MTNEEQAKAIAEEYKDIRYDWDDSPIKEYEKIALDMAEWKDQQFKEFLKKKKEQFYHQPKDLIGGWEKKYKLEMLNEIINELFNEN